MLFRLLCESEEMLFAAHVDLALHEGRCSQQLFSNAYSKPTPSIHLLLA
jgi:hypothetical protein